METMMHDGARPWFAEPRATIRLWTGPQRALYKLSIMPRGRERLSAIHGCAEPPKRQRPPAGRQDSPRRARPPGTEDFHDPNDERLPRLRRPGCLVRRGGHGPGVLAVSAGLLRQSPGPRPDGRGAE